jgi:hypothetical protein
MKAQRLKSFWDYYYIKAMAILLMAIRCTNGVLFLTDKIQMKSKPQNGVCSLWLGMFEESWQELK